METRDLEKAEEFASWWIWMPDLALDLMAPSKGAIKLHTDQRVFMRAGTRFFSEHGCFPRGYGKCVAGDTMLFTSEGINEIGSYFGYQNDDRERISYQNINVINRNGEIATSYRGIYSGYRPTKTIRTHEGYEIECTHLHPLLIMDKDGEIKFKKAQDLDIGDKVVISRNNNFFSNNTNITHENDWFNITSKYKVVPQDVLNASKECQKRFLYWLFNDNTFIYSDSKKLIKQVQMMLLNFGIIAKIQYNMYNGYSIVICDADDVIPYQEEYIKELYSELKIKSDIYDLTYNKLDVIMSMNGIEKCTAYNHLKEIRDRHYYFATISEIDDGYNHVYDLEVPNTHSFVSNGFVSHNTFLEFANMVIVCIRYPNIELALTAQTKENAASLLKDKYNELIRYYPMIINEIVKVGFSKGDALIQFKNGARIDALANAQSSKGQRRKRMSIEESNLMDKVIFEDALEPVVEVGRTTCGSLAITNPEEMNQQINFYTTPG